MNDKLIMENYLLILKSTVEVYVHGTLESSNNNVREQLKQSLNSILSMQATTYEEMMQRSWYLTNNIDKSKIIETLNNLQTN